MNTLTRMAQTERGAAYLERLHCGAYPGVRGRQRFRRLLREAWTGPHGPELLNKAAKYRQRQRLPMAFLMVESARIYRLEGRT